MTLEQIRQREVYQTRGIAEAVKDKPAAYRYVLQCLQRLYSGNNGAIPAEDTDANNSELAAGEGRIVARYKAAEGLQEDIYIIASFSESMADSLDANKTMIMFVSEH